MEESEYMEEVKEHKNKYSLYQKIRHFLYTKIVKLMAGSIGDEIRVNNFTRITKNTHIGNYSNFNGMCVQGNGNVKIGDYFHSGKDVLIITDNHNYEGTEIPYDSTDIVKDVVIDDFVWIGTKVIILGGVHISEGAIIQAGAVVVNDIPACAIAGGNPARVFKYRNKEHFYELKAQKRYH